MPTDQSNVQAIIGELKAGFNFLRESAQKSQERIDQNHERMLHAIGEISKTNEDGRRRIYERIEDHERDNAKSFEGIAKALEKLISINIQVEKHEDRLDSNERAYLDHERRLQNQETAYKVAAEVSSTNGRWLKVIGAVLLALAGDHFTGSKLADIVSHIGK